MEGSRRNASHKQLILTPSSAQEGESTLLDNNRGDCGIIFEVRLADGSIARVQPNQHVRVEVTPALTNSIKEVMVDCRVELVVQRASTAAR